MAVRGAEQRFSGRRLWEWEWCGSPRGLAGTYFGSAEDESGGAWPGSGEATVHTRRSFQASGQASLEIPAGEV